MATRDTIERFGDRAERLPWGRARKAEPTPIALHRRRIYILPTRFGLFIAAMLATLVLGALNYNNNPGLILGFLLIAVALNSLIHAHLLLSGLKLHTVQAEPVHAGAVMNIRLLLENNSQRPRRGLVLLCEQSQCAFDLPTQSSTEQVLPLRTHQRGWLQLGRLRLSTRQPFGLALAWCWLKPDTPLLVYPALEQNAPDLPETQGDGESQHSRRSGEQPHHLRDYRPGDAPRQIAWKASARNSRLLVREYDASTSREITLDWAKLSALDFESRISRLARWVVEAERSGSRYLLILPTERVGPGRGSEHRHACLRALALLPQGGQRRD